MQVFTDIEKYANTTPAVVTMGFFDGVHAGHRKILSHLVDESKKKGHKSVVVTFWPHPRFVLHKEPSDFKLLNTLAEKIALLSSLAIDELIVLPFNEKLSSTTAHDFVQKILIDKLHTSKVILGYDHRFGLNREGGFDFLCTHAAKYGFEVEEISRHDIDSNTVSSTQIRNAIEQGKITTATQLLGAYYSLSGEVVKGKQLGRTIGYPTANIVSKEDYKLIPADGVYAVQVLFEGKTYGGMLNIGNNPTIAGKGRSTEVNIFDFDEDIYGKDLQVNFIKRLRSEVKFNGLDALKAQLAQDKVDALSCLKLGKS